MKIFRPHVSEYFSSQFTAHEKLKLESIDKTTYVYSWKEDPHILLTNTSVEINPNKMGSVRLIVHANSGHEPFKKKFVEKFPGFIVMGNVIRTQAVVQYILSCIFQRHCQPPFSRKWDPVRCWERTLLKDLKILLVGYGHIGQKLTSILTAMDATPDIYDPWLGHDKLEPTDADMVILCCSKNHLNKNFINSDFLNKISSGATIINSARGSLIDESALVNFLENNPKSFAFLDVYEKEPCHLKKFHHLTNIATSSHVAGIFKTIEQKIIDFEYDVIKNFVTCPETFMTNYAKMILSPCTLVEEPDRPSARVPMSTICPSHKTKKSSISLI